LKHLTSIDFNARKRIIALKHKGAQGCQAAVNHRATTSPDEEAQDHSSRGTIFLNQETIQSKEMAIWINS
jgi:hypothetical protein